MDQPMSRQPRPYHHGDLPAALLRAVEALIMEKGVSSLSLREVARRAGVSHGAPAHHFGDKAGLLTTLAIEGFHRFIAALSAARDAAPSAAQLSATGKAYVRFAVRHPAHFSVMFRSDILRDDDPELVRLRGAAHDLLHGVVAQAPLAPPPGKRNDLDTLAMRAWSMAHGLAELYLAAPRVTLEKAGQPDLDALLDAVFGPEPPR